MVVTQFFPMAAKCEILGGKVGFTNERISNRKNYESISSFHIIFSDNITLKVLIS